MSINELRNHLDNSKPVPSLFADQEIDHVLVTAYQIIKWAIRDQCDIIEVTLDYAIWSKQGVKIGKLPTPVSFRPYFEKILDRDKIVQTHVLLVMQTEDSDIYKLVD